MANCCCSGGQESVPRPLVFTFKDYWKIGWEWLMAFRKTFIVEPGLYYSGSIYDKSAPLIVTSNYHLTVWSVWRRIKHRNLRVLVIDTEGINVWCSSGKGRFSAAEILKQVNRYPSELLREDDMKQLILPKLALSGVRMADLRQAGISPVIGPVYAGELPSFLDNQPYRDCVESHYKFDLQDRLFTLLPSWVQVLYYSVLAGITAGIIHLFLPTGIWWQLIPIGMIIATLYILCFPWLPTKSFVGKGAFLNLILMMVYLIFAAGNPAGIWESFFYLSYISGFSIFFGLYYTGNSGVSNYSTVKRETIVFLPIVIILMLAAVFCAIMKGVSG